MKLVICKTLDSLWAPGLSMSLSSGLFTKKSLLKAFPVEQGYFKTAYGENVTWASYSLSASDRLQGEIDLGSPEQCLELGLLAPWLCCSVSSVCSWRWESRSRNRKAECCPGWQDWPKAQCQLFPGQGGGPSYSPGMEPKGQHWPKRVQNISSGGNQGLQLSTAQGDFTTRKEKLNCLWEDEGTWNSLLWVPGLNLYLPDLQHRGCEPAGPGQAPHTDKAVLRGFLFLSSLPPLLPSFPPSHPLLLSLPSILPASHSPSLPSFLLEGFPSSNLNELPKYNKWGISCHRGVGMLWIFWEKQFWHCSPASLRGNSCLKLSSISAFRWDSVHFSAAPSSAFPFLLLPGLRWYFENALLTWAQIMASGASPACRLMRVLCVTKVTHAAWPQLPHLDKEGTGLDGGFLTLHAQENANRAALLGTGGMPRAERWVGDFHLQFRQWEDASSMENVRLIKLTESLPVSFNKSVIQYSSIKKKSFVGLNSKQLVCLLLSFHNI